MAEATSDNGFAFIHGSRLGIRHHDTTLVAGQDDTTWSRPCVFRNVSNCQPHATVPTHSLAADLVVLENTDRWYVFGFHLFDSIEADAKAPMFIAEWAIARLQFEARHTTDAQPQKPRPKSSSASDKDLASSKADDETERAVDIGRYHCKFQSHHGDLYVSSNDARYVTAVRSNLLWALRYDNCKTIRKQSDSGLIFELMDDSEIKVMGLALRNEVFTQIIGYSGLAWQVTG